MELVAGSKHHAVRIVTALDVAGREHLVIVAKATWAIPEPGARPHPLPPQPLIDADQYHGDPGASAMRVGHDFARYKPRCDVLFDAQAHSADGPVQELIVGWKVGGLQKGLKAVGPRRWRLRMGLWTLTEPEPFTQMPLHHGLAFGGTLAYRAKDELRSDVLETNPAGIGWAGPHSTDLLDGAPAPCLEALDDPIRRPSAKHRPIAFSAIGSHWMPRRQWAGTYDEQWQQEVFPLLPQDFDERFHQAAPDDQQLPYPEGGEEVVLLNMMPGRPQARFRLPSFNALAIRVLRTDYRVEELVPVVDTLFFEPAAGRFSAVWRASVPIQRRLQEFDTIAVGPVDPQWWKAKTLGLDGACVGCGSTPEDDA